MLFSDWGSDVCSSDLQPLDIAIIGVAGIYPGAGNARQYWQNILDKVDAVRDADPEWVGPYFEENATDDDRIYTTRGGFLGEHARVNPQLRSEEHTSELQSLMRSSYAVFCLKKKT